ncbi:hypothetical protein HPE56_14310 [Maribacter sp. ANRC-HE7]|uniref:Collagen triple helix repeat-containing protein n=1 Tax=Maribacter aquimaris TaxID=2737171 RepID=A0ABR7V4S6_9FLAO|nr:hypothetical protein [Maribacter aquimaris]MBD0778970.1 hypothetical protein [Maribacter aquimaris]
MKSTMKFFTYGILIFALVFSSCSKDGDVGPIGPAGTDGVDGINGEDGNANVQTFVFKNAIGNNGRLTLMIPEITKNIFDDGVVLGFVQPGEGSLAAIQMPYHNGTNQIIGGFYQIGSYSFQVYDEGNRQVGFDGDVLLNSIHAYRVVIIQPSNTTTITGNGSGKTFLPKNGKEAILDELSKAQVDIHDYYAVCEYYGVCKN